MQSKTEKIAVISGGAGHVGSAIIEALVKNGWSVASLSHSDKTVAGGRGYVCDVTDEHHVRDTIAKIATQGTIRACIHAAASPTVRKPILSLSKDEFDADLETALSGAFILAKETIPQMKKDGVFIGITTASLEDKVPTKSVGSYIPAKAGLRGFLRTLAQELKQEGIRVNAVAPGFIAGGLNRDLPEKVREFVAKKSDPEGVTLREVAETVLGVCENNPLFPTGTSVLLPGKIVSAL